MCASDISSAARLAALHGRRASLALAVALVGLVSGVAVASAQEATSAARTRVAVYHDDDETTVVTAGVEAQGAIADTLVVRADYLVDAVSTASVDVVSAATGRWDELRHDYRGSLDLLLDDVVLSAGYGRSVENDYGSHRISAGGAVDVADGAATLSLGGALILSEVGRADEDNFEEPLTTIAGDARWVQAVNPELLTSLGYSWQYSDGYQASPYRFVRSEQSAPVAERHPQTRMRHALVGRARWAVGEQSVLFGDERLYLDDWGVLGTTTQLGLVQSLSGALDLELRNRFHFQAAASFWEERYVSERKYMSADRELSTFIDDYVGPALVLSLEDVGPITTLRMDARADLFYYRFLDYAYLDSRVGTLASVGVSGEF